MNARQDKWVRLGKSEKKRREGRGFPRAGRAAPRNFLRAKPKGNPEEQPCQHRRLRIGLLKIHRQFRIGPAKIHKRFRIGPPQVTINLLLPEFQSQGILVYHGYYARKATKVPI